MAETLPKKERPRPNILRILSASLVILYTGLGPVKGSSAEFNQQVEETAKHLPKRGESEKTSTYLNSVSSDFARLFKEHPSLRKTIELYSEKEVRELFDLLEQFVNANFYVDYPSIRQGGEINVYPDTRVLINGIKRLIVDELKGKLVSDRENAEFVISEIIIYVNKFSDKRTKIIPGVIEAINVDPHMKMEILVKDERQKLRPKEKVTFKGYSKIPIEELRRKGTGDFYQNELNKAAEEAIKNIVFFIQTLYRQRQFIEATKHLRTPVFPIDRALLIDMQFKKVFYPVFLDEKSAKYFQPGDIVRVFYIDPKTKEPVIVEKFKMPSDYFYIENNKERNDIIVFIPSSRFKPGDEMPKEPLYIEKVEK